MGGRGGKRFVDFGVIRQDGVMAVLEAQSGLRKEQRRASGRGRQREKPWWKRGERVSEIQIK